MPSSAASGKLAPTEGFIGQQHNSASHREQVQEHLELPAPEPVLILADREHDERDGGDGPGQSGDPSFRPVIFTW